MENKTYKVLMVDDERKALDLIYTIVDWKSLNCRVVDALESGYEALDFLNDHTIDVLITDIEMPYMNGEELARNVRQQYPNVSIIYLTAHDDFNYAKKGIEMGINQYVLKPIVKDELIQAIANVIEGIEKSRRQKDILKRYQDVFDANIGMLRNEMLLKLLKNQISLEDFKQRETYYQIDLSEDSLYRVYSIELETGLVEEDNKFGTYIKFKDELEDKLDNKKTLMVSYSTEMFFIVVQDETYSIVDIDNLLRNTKYKFDITATVGIGRCYSLEHIALSYNESLEALKCKALYGVNTMYEYERVNYIDKRTRTNNDRDLLKLIGSDLKLCKENELAESIVTYITEEPDNILKCRIKSIEVLNVIIQTCEELRTEINDDLEVEDAYKEIMYISNMKEIIAFLSNRALYAIKSIKNKRSKKNQSLINDVKNCLYDNYTNSELNMHQVSERFYVNQSFLSRIFKEEEKTTLVDYLCKIRIEEAVKLATNTDLRMYEIASKVGIPDPNYFSKCFKKITGISYSHFKKQE